MITDLNKMSAVVAKEIKTFEHSLALS